MPIALLTAADAPRYRTLMLEAYTQAADAFTSTAEERAREPLAWWAQRIAHPQGLGLALGATAAAGPDAPLVGTVALELSAKPKTAHRAELIGMYVQPGHRGQGLARALLQAALVQCAARPQLQTVTLTVTEGNTPALALYTALGFSLVGTEPMAIRTPEGFRGKCRMWKQLG